MTASEFIDALTAAFNQAAKTLIQQIKVAKSDGKISGFEWFQIMGTGAFQFQPVVTLIYEFVKGADADEVDAAEGNL